MAAILRIVGWLAAAVGLIFIVLPLLVSPGLSLDTMISLCIFLLVMGPMLIGLSALIETAERIQANTNWLSSGAAPAAQATQAVSEVSQPAAVVPDPVPEPDPVPAPEPVREATPVAAAARPAPQARPQKPTPELYDASKHPAAVDEWTHEGRRVMTLEDGTFATEVDGAWYKFLQLEDIADVRD